MALTISINATVRGVDTGGSIKMELVPKAHDDDSLIHIIMPMIGTDGQLMTLAILKEDFKKLADIVDMGYY